MSLLQNGPYVYALGCLYRPDLAVRTARMPGESLDSPVRFTDDGGWEIVSPLSQEEKRQPLSREILKESGVARARNSSRSTIFAALLAKGFLARLGGQPDFDPDRVAMGVCNCSSSAAISWEFEMEGVTRGWENANTMLMPSALPSALGTQVSAAVNTHAATITFLNDILGMCSAFEYMFLNFFHERADYGLIIGAEEFTETHDMVSSHFGTTVGLDMDGAAGVLLARNRPAGASWQFALCRHVAGSQDIPLPEPWTRAKTLRLNLDGNQASFTTLLLPYALHHLFAQQPADKAVFVVNFPDRSNFALGFQHVPGTA